MLSVHDTEHHNSDDIRWNSRRVDFGRERASAWLQNQNVSTLGRVDFKEAFFITLPPSFIYPILSIQWVFLTTLPVDSQEVLYISHVQFFRLVFSGKSWRPCQTLASITSASRLVIGLGRWIQASLSLTRSSTTPIPWELSSTSRGCLSGSISWGWELTSTCMGLQALRTGERIFLRKNYFEVEGLTTAGGLVQQTGWKRGRWRVVDCPTQLINIYQDIAG